VTPILEGNYWDIGFLNGYMDWLCAALPVDRDRVYLQGHSLGAIATWEWPWTTRSASPRFHEGGNRGALPRLAPQERALLGHRCEKDNVISTGYPDQMVTALQACGASVTYTILKGSEHNMPDDFDDSAVSEWYLRLARSHQPVPPDPRDALGLGADGSSSWRLSPAGASVLQVRTYGDAGRPCSEGRR